MKTGGFRLDDAGSKWWVWTLALPVGATFVFLFLFGTEADSSWEMMAGSLLCAGTLGLLNGKMGRGFWASALAAIWFSVFVAWRRWDWVLDMHSPRGSAQGMAEYFFGWKDAPSLLAFAIFEFAAAGVGWLIAALDQRHVRATGRSCFDED